MTAEGNVETLLSLSRHNTNTVLNYSKKMKLFRYDIGNTKKQTNGFCLFFYKYNATEDENYHKDRLVKKYLENN